MGGIVNSFTPIGYLVILIGSCTLGACPAGAPL
jgi:hypothetical protein